MASAGPSFSEPREDTPLLQADASPTGSTHPRDDHDVEESQAIDRQLAVARVDKALKVLFALTIGVGGIALGFNIARMVLSKYGSERFGYIDYPTFMLYEWQLFWQVLLAIVISIFNLVHLSQRRRPLPALLNILIFGIDGVCAFFFIFDALSNSNALFGGLCRSNLDDPDPDWGTEYPGSLKECHSWEPTYQIMTWLWLCFELVASLLMLAIAIKSLVRVYKLRSTREGGDGGEVEGRRWTIPAGQINFEVGVYWGAPAPRGEGRPRQSESVEEDRQGA